MLFGPVYRCRDLAAEGVGLELGGADRGRSRAQRGPGEDAVSDPLLATPSGKPRARALGIPFSGAPGRWNAITDVPGVEVGYATRIEGTDIRTGVTAVLPRGSDGIIDPCAAGFHSQNGNGEMTGVSWIRESGTTNLPIAITNTHAVGVAHASIVRWAVRHHPELAEWWWWLLLPPRRGTAT